MKLFTRKTTKLKERIQSLEEHIGAVYVIKDDYAEHQADSQAYNNTLERRVKTLEDKKGKK